MNNIKEIWQERVLLPVFIICKFSSDVFIPVFKLQQDLTIIKCRIDAILYQLSLPQQDLFYTET